MAIQRDIPLIFLPSTAASSLDTQTPFDYAFPGDEHTFPEICQTCWLGSLKHHEQVFHYHPSTLDRAGPRVWIGPEAFKYFLEETLVGNQGNHYFDVLKFDDSGHNTLFPQIQVGSVLQTVTLEPTGILPTIGVYDALIQFLTKDPQGPMKPLNTGPNGLYFFPYDWRADLPDLTEQLGAFIDSVLQRPDVREANIQKVALLTHSLGGLVSRAYYLSSPDNAQQEFLSTAVLTPAESADTTPPTTTVSIQNGEIMLSATDHPGGSGVWRTYYTTDAHTFSLYDQPLPLPAEARIVLGFSIDRNGNREYPGMALPVLQVSQSQIVFTATPHREQIAPQTVHVINADPIPLTGPLQWEASTDVPWLTLEPKEGTTPGHIRLSVQEGQREAGIAAGHVIVRSTTPGVVYSERRISVVLQEEGVEN